MATSLLSTKFYIPPARADSVSRPRLVEKLLSGVNRPGSFTLLSGPAGSGKTTLLSQFAAQLRRPVAWLSLDEGDNDPIQFGRYLITACQSILNHVGEAALELLGTSQPLADDTIPTILINDLAARERPIILVLDDYHEIQNPSIHASLLFLLDHLPANLHIVISTRTDPPWPLARFRARNQLSEIRTQDLRFSSAEAADFLGRTMGLDLSVEDVTALTERTEGWVAALQLAGLSLQGRSDIPAFVKAFTGSHVYVAEYLVEEILQRQSEEVQNFLLQTSILKRMSAGLCEAVTGCQDGQAILQALHRANNLIVSLDDEGHWFRYHHLFADLLQARLRQSLAAEAIAALQLRAAKWYKQHGFVLESVNHTLTAGDFEGAAALVDQVGQTMILTDQYVLEKWLNELPEDSFQAYPRLEICRVLIDLSKGTLDMYEKTLLEKEKLIKALPPSPENDRLRLEAMVYLSLFMAFQNTSLAIQMAQEALLEIPEGNPKLRAYLFSALYRAHGMDGDIEKSEPAYLECFRLSQAAGHYGMLSDTTMIRAFDLCQYGRLDEAARYCQLIIETGSRLKRKLFYPAGHSYIGLAGIHLERNELEKAEHYLEQGIELCRQGARSGLYTGHVQKTRLYQAKGEYEKAMAELQLLEQTLQRRDFTLMTRQVSLRLAMGNIVSASRLVTSLLQNLGDSPYAHQLPLIAKEAFQLSLARIYIAQGEIQQANQMLDGIQATVEPGKRWGRLMEVHLLRALAVQKQNGGYVSPEAIASLEWALDLAEPAGFVLLILEEGPALIPLLNATVNRGATPGRSKAYARKLLGAFGEDGQAATTGLPDKAAGLVESLTPREMEVLLLLVAGDSNQAIADKLFITIRTVKKHAGNIYGKLNVSNRTQAAARAREIGLLPTDR